jgi:hypothetical protein
MGRTPAVRGPDWPPGRRSADGARVAYPERRPSQTRQPAEAEVSVASVAAGRDRALDRAGLLALSGERDRDLRRILAAWREGYAAGRADGWRDGYAKALDEEAAAWRRVAGRVGRGAGDPSFAELERRRWGPGGREHFADPRPGDFPGTEGAGRA